MPGFIPAQGVALVVTHIVWTPSGLPDGEQGWMAKMENKDQHDPIHLGGW